MDYLFWYALYTIKAKIGLIFMMSCTPVLLDYGIGKTDNSTLLDEEEMQLFTTINLAERSLLIVTISNCI